jgi:hypothetical protein
MGAAIETRRGSEEAAELVVLEAEVGAEEEEEAAGAVGSAGLARPRSIALSHANSSLNLDITHKAKNKTGADWV